MYLDNLTRPQLIANITPREHGFVSKMQTLIPSNINEFTVLVRPHFSSPMGGLKIEGPPTHT